MWIEVDYMEVTGEGQGEGEGGGMAIKCYEDHM